MFERATIFSALFILIFFGVLGTKYLEFMVAKDSVTPASVNSSLKVNSD